MITNNVPAIPAINPEDGTQLCDTCFLLPPTESGFGLRCFKAADIRFDLNGVRLLSNQQSGDHMGYTKADQGSAHIQSFTLSTPLGRESLSRLGNTYAFAKEIEYPITATLSVSAIVSDLKKGNLIDEIYCGNEVDLKIRMQNPVIGKKKLHILLSLKQCENTLLSLKCVGLLSLR